MFGFKKCVSIQDFLVTTVDLRKEIARNIIDITKLSNDILVCNEELRGWQTAMYSLMNVLHLDLDKDVNGNIVITPRSNGTKPKKNGGKK